MNPPRVSVVMSVYNGEAYLSEAIESVLDQTMEDFEFIIIDDGSSDGSLEIIKAYALKDKRIVLINRENRGLIASLNEGIEKARGSYIARMDADDIALPERLQIEYDFMQRHPEIGLVGSWIEVLDADVSGQVGRYSVDDAMLRCELLFAPPFAHPTVMIRRDVLMDNALRYDSSYRDAEDYALWYQLSRVTRMENIPQVLLRYRVLAESVTRVADMDDLSREKTLRGVYGQMLERLGMRLTDDEKTMHYTMTLNTRIARHYFAPKVLSAYFDRLVMANHKQGLFSRQGLLLVLGKKWLWHTMYHLKKHPGLLVSMLLSRYSYYGLLALYQNRKEAFS